MTLERIELSNSVVVDLFLHDTCKTANVNHRHINNNNTATIRKNLKVYDSV